MERQLQEKRELRAEFARDIEAAKSQMSEKEDHLIKEHWKVLQQLKDKHQQGNKELVLVLTFLLQNLSQSRKLVNRN